jgi:hypothetical protein
VTDPIKDVGEALRIIIDDLIPYDPDVRLDPRDVTDAIEDRFAVIPKEPTDGLEVDVPGWVVSQIEAAVRAEMHVFIERASNLAFDSAARDTAMYLKGWNECVETAKRGEEVGLVEPEDEADEDIDEAMRQADA